MSARIESDARSRPAFPAIGAVGGGEERTLMADPDGGPSNIALKQTVGSHSLAAAAHRER
jgi:hypothetical protein